MSREFRQGLLVGPGAVLDDRVTDLDVPIGRRSLERAERAVIRCFQQDRLDVVEGEIDDRRQPGFVHDPRGTTGRHDGPLMPGNHLTFDGGDFKPVLVCDLSGLHIHATKMGRLPPNSNCLASGNGLSQLLCGLQGIVQVPGVQLPQRALRAVAADIEGGQALSATVVDREGQRPQAGFQFLLDHRVARFPDRRDFIQEFLFVGDGFGA